MDPKKEGVGQRVAVNTSRLDAESRPMEGWLDGAVLDLADDDLVEAVKPIRYELSVQRFDDELLVSGSVAVEMDLVCVKTAEIFSTTVSDFAFVRSFPLQQEAEDVDLTEEIRESILLLVPVHPVHPSPSADPVGVFHQREDKRLEESLKDEEKEPEAGLWDSLDGLDFENE